MSIQNSMNFINKASADNQFRATLNALSPDEITTSLKESGLEFTDHEFEESINLMHVKCQYEEQANRLFEIVNWYRLLTI